MGLAEGIRKHGFRKWYERELLQGHAHLVLTFLCAVGVLAGLEAFHSVQPLGERLIDLATIVLCSVLGVRSVRRYLYLLNHAEFTANQADCPQCKAYARFTLEGEDRRAQTVLVCCRKCGHRWTIAE